MASVTIDDQLTAARDELKAAQVKLASDQQALVKQQVRLQDWMRDYRGPGNSTEADAAIADAQSWIMRYNQDIQTDQGNIKSIGEHIASLEQQLAQYNAHLADAAGKGLVGEQAETYAKGKLAQAITIKWVVIIAAVALGLVGMLWAWRKFKKVK